MALLEELLMDLPGEPPRAIVVFADKVVKKVTKTIPDKRPGTTDDYAAISSFILKFCSKYNIDVDLTVASNLSVYEHMNQMVQKIVAKRHEILSTVIDTEIDRFILQYDSKLGETFGVAKLTADEKKRIHAHLDKIRSLIESSDLPERKRNALFDRLNQLAREVDSVGTGTDRFFSFMGDLGINLGEFGKNAKPLFDEARGMIQSISRARARQEGVSLPPGDEPLMLPNPDKTE